MRGEEVEPAARRDVHPGILVVVGAQRGSRRPAERPDPLPCRFEREQRLGGDEVRIGTRRRLLHQAVGGQLPAGEPGQERGQRLDLFRLGGVREERDRGLRILGGFLEESARRLVGRVAAPAQRGHGAGRALARLVETPLGGQEPHRDHRGVRVGRQAIIGARERLAGGSEIARRQRVAGELEVERGGERRGQLPAQAGDPGAPVGAVGQAENRFGEGAGDLLVPGVEGAGRGEERREQRERRLGARESEEVRGDVGEERRRQRPGGGERGDLGGLQPIDDGGPEVAEADRGKRRPGDPAAALVLRSGAAGAPVVAFVAGERLRAELLGRPRHGVPELQPQQRREPPQRRLVGRQAEDRRRGAGSLLLHPGEKGGAIRGPQGAADRLAPPVVRIRHGGEGSTGHGRSRRPRTGGERA